MKLDRQQKSSDPRQRRRHGHFGKNRESWVTVNGHAFILYYKRVQDKSDPTDENEPDSEDDRLFDQVTVTWKPPTRQRGVAINLTHLTQQELRELRRYFERAFDVADPLCAEQDAAAREDWEKGDDTNPRLYRPIPELAIRERLQPTLGTGVHRRSEGVSDVDDADGDSVPASDESRDSGSSVDHVQPPGRFWEQLESQNDATQGDESEDVREVLGNEGFPV